MADVQAGPFLIPAKNSKFDLSLIAAENADGLRATFEFNTDLFDPSTIERMASHFQNLLRAVVADPSLKASDAPLLAPAEQHQLLVDWNETQTAFPQRCLHDLITTQSQLTPERIAVVFGSQQLSYSDLDARSNQFAQYLRKAGVGPESLVGLCLERSPDMLVALLAILKAGGGYVPLDPSYPADRIQFILNDAQAPVLVTQEKVLSNLTTLEAHTIVLDTAWPEIGRESTAPLCIETKPESLAYVLYTSGSTGKPKGVQIEHGSLVNFLTSMAKQPGITAADTLLAVTTLSFDIAGLELYLPLITGAKIVLASREQAADGNKLLTLLNESQTTVLQATPATWRMLLDSGWTGSPQLKALCGGEAMPSDLAEQLVPRCAELWNMYGPTETTIWSSVFKVESKLDGAAPIGRPIDNTTMYVLDEKLQPAPLGVAGELFIGGAGVARGYFKRPELTSEKFLADPFRPGQRIYRTGDLAKFQPDGNIQFLGRADFQVKVRGFRIELGEIETILSQVAAIQQSVVLVREDRPGDTRLVAYLVFRAGQTVSPSDLRVHLKQSLPDYMVPSAFVTLDALPLTPNGKIDRKALPKPEDSRDTIASSAPRDDFEHLVLCVWQRVLGVKDISVTDNFFEIGGHSLLAVRMLNEIKRATNREIPLAELFRGATIEHLAKIVRTETAPVSHLTVTAIQPHGAAPPFFAVVSPGLNSLGYLTLSRILGSEQPFYKLQGPGEKVLHRPYTPQESERMALDYVRSMRAEQPEGPYYFGGMCQGAHIAFDMAKVLESQGQTVGLLAIFDTWVVENNQNRSLWYLYYYGQRLKKFWKLPARRKWAGLTGVLRKKAQRVAATKSETQNAWQASYWPGKDFVPPQVNTSVTVFKIPRQPFYYVSDPLMGWGSRTTKSVAIRLIEAKHLLMLRKPWVRNLGKALGESLQLAHQQQPLNSPVEKSVDAALRTETPSPLGSSPEPGLRQDLPSAKVTSKAAAASRSWSSDNKSGRKK